MARIFDQVWRSFQTGMLLQEGELLAWEQKEGVRLPEDYRHFMLRCNGGVLRPFVFDSPAPELTFGNPHDVLTMMYDWQEVLENSQVQVEPRLRNTPPGRLAIGVTESELTILIRIGDEDAGHIEAWPTNVFEAWGDGQNTRVWPLAANFSGFVDMLHDAEGVSHYYWAGAGTDFPSSRQVMLP